MGVCCSTREKFVMSGPAPYLDEYFKLQREVAQCSQSQELIELATQITMAIFFEKDDEFQELEGKVRRLNVEVAKKLEPLKDIIGKSFEVHDQNKDGVLSEEEGQVFIRDYMERYVAFVCETTADMLDDLKAKQIKGCCGDKDAIAFLTKAFDEQRKQMIDGAKAKGEAYKHNKAAKDKAGFAALDANKDGKLTKNEVVACLTPNTEEYFRFVAALELSSEAEIAQQRCGMVVKRKSLAGEPLVKEDLQPK